MSKLLYSQDLLIQAGTAANLINALANSASFAHQGETQISIEKAIISLLAPFQPEQAEEIQLNGQAGNPGTASTPKPEDERCPDCGQIHTAEHKALTGPLLEMLESIFGKGSVELVRRTPDTKH